MLREALATIQPRLGSATAKEASGTRKADLLPRLGALSEALRAGRYEPEPLQEFRIPKGIGKAGTRTLHLPSATDRVLQEAVRAVLTRRLEPRFLDCSYAYRPGKGPLKAIRQVDHHLGVGECTVVAIGDIADCFPSIDRPLLLGMLNEAIRDDRLVALVERWLEAGVITPENHWAESRNGLPQGSALSPLLSNLYLTAFDQPMVSRGARLVRYADDFVILCRSRAEATATLAAAEHLLAERLNLTLRKDRREIRDIPQGFEFLGIQFVGRERRLAPERLAAMRERCVAIAQRHATDPRSALVELGESASGWNRYYGRLLSPTALVPLRDATLEALESLVRAAFKAGTLPGILGAVEAVPIPGVHSDRPRRELIRNVVRRASANEPRRAAKPAEMRRRRRRQAQQVARVGHLSVHEPGTFVGKAGPFLVLRRDRKVVERLAFTQLKSLAVAQHGVSLSTDVLQSCAEAGVPLFVESPDYRMVALVASPRGSDAKAVERQVLFAADPVRSGALAARFCLAKIANQAALMKYLAKAKARAGSGLRQRLPRFLAAARQAMTDIRTAGPAPGNSAFQSTLMGYEAQVAVGYWELVRAVLGPDTTFEQRVHPDATDPVNAMLNYGYAILSRQVHLAVLAAGLLPEVGFLHAPANARPSLVYDLMEEFRAPVVDRVVLAMIGRREPSTLDDEGRLTVATRERLRRHLQVRLATPVPFRGVHRPLEQLVDHQARALRQHLEGTKAYQGFRMRW